VLTDGRSPASDQLANQIADADFLFDALLDAEAGAFIVASYDADGEVVERASFNLAGNSDVPLYREADARNQAACATKAMHELLPATGGDLLRSLPSAFGLAKSRTAEGGSAVVLALGLGRSAGGGFVAAEADFGSRQSIDHNLNEFRARNLLPVLDRDRVSLFFLAPTEGSGSGATDNGLVLFAEVLCAELLGSDRCDSAAAVGS